MAGTRKPPSPSGLKTAGKKLWDSVIADFDLEEHEKITLKEACRTADRLDELDKEMESEPLTVVNSKGDETANPRIVEQRQQSMTFIRLMASLKLPDESGAVPQSRGAARGTYGRPMAV